MTHTIADLIEEELNAKGVNRGSGSRTHLHDHSRSQKARCSDNHKCCAGPAEEGSFQPCRSHVTDQQEIAIGVVMIALFSLKLSAGIALMWWLMPRREVTDGFFRIQMRVLLGADCSCRVVPGSRYNMAG